MALRCPRSVKPWEQVADPSDLVVGDAAEHIGELGVQVDVIEFRRLDRLKAIGADLPPPAELTKRRFFRPRATGFITSRDGS